MTLAWNVSDLTDGAVVTEVVRTAGSSGTEHRFKVVGIDYAELPTLRSLRFTLNHEGSSDRFAYVALWITTIDGSNLESQDRVLLLGEGRCR